MRLRRKSVDIVVSGDGERARPGTEPNEGMSSAPDAAIPQRPSAPEHAAPVPADAIPSVAPAPPSNGNGANGNGSNGGGPGADAPPGIPFGAAVATFARPSTPTPSTTVAPPVPVAPNASAQGGGVATLAPPLAATAAPISYAAPVATPAPAPAAPAPVATPVAPAPVSAPAAPVAAPAAPTLAPVPTQAAPVAPIVWTAPGWQEYRRRIAALAAAPPAALTAAPPAALTAAPPAALTAAPSTEPTHAPVGPAPHVLSSPLAVPSATPAPAAVPSNDSTPEASADASDQAAPEVAPPTAGTSSHLGEMLLSHDLVTREQLDQALAEQSASGMRIGTQLVSMGFVTERELVSVLAKQFEMRVADLRLVAPEPEAVALVPEDLARRLEVVPVRMTPEGLEVARADALSDDERREIETAINGTIVPVLATPSEIQRAIDSTYQALAGMAQQVQAYADLASTRAPVETGTQIVVDDRAPVVQVVTLLLTQAVRDRSSDIHIEPQDGDVRVRFRIDGVLREITTIPAAMAQALISRIKVMADMNIVERRRSQDGQITTEVDGRPLDVRVATTATIWGEKAVLRLLDKTRSLLALSELGMTRDIARQFSELVVSPFGMVICAGPTGSGKTTTLYAALNEINSPERNITTIEDPVEYVLPRINQIQVNRQAGITFADGLKSIMRQDPDVILVGEIRDVETARIAVQSALTGHFVLSSLHATDCATALQRFRDMGIEPFLINSSVLALEAQRLVRRICVHCREPYEPTVAERMFFSKATGIEKETWTHGAGCNLCSHTGYSERIGVYELMRITDQIQELVLADAGHDEIQAVAMEGGMRTLKDEAVRLVGEDITTVAEAFRSVYTR